MKIKKCGCKYCRRGLRNRKMGKMVTSKRRAARHKAKVALHRGVDENLELVEEPDTEFKIPYTD